VFLSASPHSARADDCGGLNQKSCWSLNPDKWCNGNLQYKGNGKPGQGRCVRREEKKETAKACGGLNQSSCWNLDPSKWCKGNLEYQGTGVPGQGTCVKAGTKPAKDCGGRGQKSCWHVDPRQWCDGGLEYVGTGKPGDGKCITPGSDYDKSCGGRNQSSCWNVDPKRWCDAGLEYFGSGKPGDGRCVVPGSDPTPDCGGDGQRSCWNANPKHWCDDGFKYSPGIIPNEGTCFRDYTDDEYRAAAQRVADSVQRIGMNNPMVNLRTCLLRPENLEQLRQVMQDRSENGVNRILSICGASPQDFMNYGTAVLGYEPKTLEIGLNAGLVAGIGADAALTYAIPLEPRPDGRYFITNGVSFGAGAAAGGDVSVALSGEEMPTKHWASDKGRSVNFSGKLLGSVSVSIDFPERGILPSGFTVGGGLGVGAEVGTITYTRDQYLYNF
jgi:hypothetical protein